MAVPELMAGLCRVGDKYQCVECGFRLAVGERALMVFQSECEHGYVLCEDCGLWRCMLSDAAGESAGLAGWFLSGAPVLN